MRLSERIVNPSGGLVYHRRALLHSWNLWAPYKRALSSWLARWRPGSRGLLLFGPSGGYTIPGEFLERFETIDCFDPDPIAQAIFRARFGRTLRARGTRLRWLSEDVLGLAPHAAFDSTLFRGALDAAPGSCLCFANLIGQALLLREEEPASASWLAWLGALEAALDGREWASVHDVVSGPAAVDRGRLASLPERATWEDLAAAFEAADADDLVDHGTIPFARGAARERLVWRLTPGWWHVIDAVMARR